MPVKCSQPQIFASFLTALTVHINFFFKSKPHKTKIDAQLVKVSSQLTADIPGFLWILVREGVQLDPKGKGTGGQHIHNFEMEESNVEPQPLKTSGHSSSSHPGLSFTVSRIGSQSLATYHHDSWSLTYNTSKQCATASHKCSRPKIGIDGFKNKILSLMTP